MFAEALAFDLDGTLTDSDPLHFAAYAEIGRAHGVTIDETCFATRMTGRTNAQILADVFAGVDAVACETIWRDKEALFRRLIVGRLRPLPGLMALLDWAARRGCGIALVSNAPRENIEAMLDELGLMPRFDAIVVANELPVSKPDPLPYATALARLGVSPARAVAFEDAVPGVLSASRAGIATVGLTTTTRPPELAQAGADLIVRDYAEPGLIEAVEAALQD